jgi:Tol biopolymer transport system component
MSRTRTPKKKLVVQELAGGRPVEIFRGPEIGYLRWSPDGSQLLIWTRGAGRNGVYVMPQLGGTLRQIVAGQFISCWSPDGSLVAIATYLAGKILLVDSRGRAQRTLTLQGDHWSIWDIDWSTSGDRLVFVSSDQQARYSIFTIRADGSDQKTILSGRAEIPSVRWAPEGDAIYYFQRVNQTVSLHRIRADSDPAAASIAGRTIITGLETDRFFALSADAKRLVYARAPYYSNLWMLDAATGRTLELTRGTSLIERPTVSPDGSTVVFNIGHEPLTNLFTMPITGGPPKQLTFLSALNVGGVWSADGTRIAFGSSQGDQQRIWTVAAAGGTPLALATSDLSDNLDLTWSPGAHILYQRAGNRNYSEIDPRTATERLLVKDGSPGWIFAPVYSPDLRKVAVMWNRPPTRGVWLIDIDTNDRGETLVYPSTAPVTWPIGWSPDGRWIYVVEGKNATFRGATSFIGETMTQATIRRIASKGGAVETVAAIPFDEIGSVSMTPDGHRFVYPVFSSRSDIWVIDNFDVPLATRQ